MSLIFNGPERWVGNQREGIRAYIVLIIEKKVIPPSSTACWKITWSS